MATPRSKATNLAEITQGGEVLDPAINLMPEEIEEPADFALLNTLAELGEGESEAKVMVYRNAKDRGSRDSYIFTCTPMDLSLDVLRRDYGGGEFRIRVIKDGRILKNQVVSVEPAPPAPTAPDSTAQFSQLASMMMAGFKEMTAVLAAKPQATGLNELAGVIAAIKPLMAPPPAQAAPPAKDPMEMLLQLLTIKKELDGGGGSGEGNDPTTAIVLKAMDTFGKPMAEMMAASQLQKGAQQHVEQQPAERPNEALQPLALAAPVPSDTAQSPGVSATAISTQDPDEMSLKLTLVKAVIMPMAAGNADPYPYANMVLDYFGDEEVQKYIAAPDWQVQLERAMPEAAQYREWFSALREQVVELLKPEPEAPGAA
jgi:hypothetical protein